MNKRITSFFTILFYPSALVAILLGAGDRSVFIVPCLLAILFACSFFITLPNAFLYSFFIFNFIIVNSYGTISLADIMFLVILFYGLLFSKEKSPLTNSNKCYLYPLIALYLLALISLFANIYQYNNEGIKFGVKFLFRFFEVIAAFYFFSRYVTESKVIKHIILLVVFLGIIQGPITIVEFVYNMSVFGYAVARTMIYGTFVTHHAYLSSATAVTMYLSIGMFLSEKTRKMKIYYAAGALSSVVAIMNSGTRSTILGIGISAILFLLLSFRINKKTLILYISALVLLTFLYLLTPLGTMVSETFAGDKEVGTVVDFSAASRILIWEGALIHYDAASPIVKLIGTGLGSYPFIQYPFTLWVGQKNITGAHNNVIHVLCEVGAIGLCLFLIHFVLLLIVFYRLDTPLSRSFFFLTIALLASGLTQETFWFQDSFPTFWLFFSSISTIVISKSINDRKVALFCEPFRGEDSGSPRNY